MLLGTKWSSLEKTVPAGRLAVFKAEKEAAESLESCQLYKQAAAAYRNLLAAVDTDLEATAKAPARWDGLQTQIRDIEKTLDNAESIPQLSSVASDIRSKIVEARKEVSLNRDFVAACGLVDKAQREAPALSQAIDSFGNNTANTPPTVKFPDATRTVEVKLNGFSGIVGEAIVKLKKEKIDQLADDGGDVTPRLAECDKIANDVLKKVVSLQGEFDKAYANAKAKKKESTLNSFLKRIDTETADFLGKVSAIGKQVDTTLADPTKRKESQIFAEFGKNQAKSAESIKTARATLTRLDELHLPSDHDSLKEIKRQRKALDAVEPDARQGRDVEKKLTDIQAALDEALKGIQTEISERKQNAQTKAQALTKKLDSLEKDNEAYKDSFTKLRTDVAIAANKLASPVFAVSDKGAQDLTAIETQLDGLKNTLKDDEQELQGSRQKAEGHHQAGGRAEGIQSAGICAVESQGRE